VDHLLATLAEQNERIVLPAPAFCEFLVFAAKDAPAYLAKIRDNPIFRIEPFDERAAIELADLELAIRAKGKKRGSAPGAPWQKVKVDRQIVAIARVHQVRCVYSDDPDIVGHGKDCRVRVVTLAELPLPPAVQEELFPQQDATETAIDNAVPKLPETAQPKGEELSPTSPETASDPTAADVQKSESEGDTQPNVAPKAHPTTEQTIPPTVELRRSGDGHPEGQAGTENQQAKGTPEGEAPASE
jgi:predicted nucleic acid-binding protein